jgi:hypothetical protein
MGRNCDDVRHNLGSGFASVENHFLFSTSEWVKALLILLLLKGGGSRR